MIPFGFLETKTGGGVVTPYPAAIIHSFRNAHGDWTNAVCAIRRDSDDAVATVFFASGVISTSSLISATQSITTPDATTLGTWLGSDNGYLRQWFGMTDDNTYDSAYRMENLVNTATEQPLIATAGVLETKNGKVCITTTGTQTMQSNGGASWDEFNSGNVWTQLYLCSTDTTDTTYVRYITSTRTGASFQGFYHTIDSRTNKKIANFNTSVALTQNEYISQTSTADQRLITHALDGSNIESWYNGTSQDKTAYSGTWVDSSFRFFRDRTNGSLYFEGSFQEHIVFPSDKTADVVDIHTDINDYYSIY
jgi:hypothetical protein